MIDEKTLLDKEENFEDRDRMLTGFVEASKQGYAITGLKGGLRYINPALSRLIGIPDTTNAIGENYLEFLPEDIKQIVQEKVLPTIMKIGSWNGELAILSENNECIPTYQQFSIVNDDAGNPKWIAVIVTDIRERMQTTDQSCKVDGRIAAILDTVPAGVVIIDRDSKTIVDVNPASVRILGHPKEELIGSVCGKYLCTLQSECSINDSDFTIKNIESSCISSEGQTVQILKTVSNITYDGRPAIIEIFIDISERKNMIADIVKERDTSRTYLDTVGSILGVMFVALDIEGNITLLSPKAAEILHCEIHSYIGANWFETFVPENIRENALMTYIKSIKGETERIDYYDSPIITSDGEERVIYWHNSFLKDDEGNIIGVMSSGEDVTEKRITEKKLIDTQEQLLRSERMAVLGKISGGIGHELRNPLAAIKNSAYFLRMVLDLNDTDLVDTLDILDSEIATCETIITSLLDYARPKVPSLRGVSLQEVVRNALEQVHETTSIHVISEIDSNIPFLLIDPTQIERVIINLARNAVQAMPDGGTLTIKGTQLDATTVSLTISDTGTGMSEETKSHLFEPLFSTKAKGIGLGLTITKSFIESHGGTIDLVSVEGKGTTFTIKIPVYSRSE